MRLIDLALARGSCNDELLSRWQEYLERHKFRRHALNAVKATRFEAGLTQQDREELVSFQSSDLPDNLLELEQKETIEETEWHRVVVWDKTAESCNSFLSKGRQVYVEGRLQTRKWEDKDGNDRYTTEIVANDVQFLGGRGGDSGPQDSGGGSAVPKDDDDIPF